MRRRFWPFSGSTDKTSPEAERAQRVALLRTRIVREMRERGWKRLGILPLTAGAGATTIAVELTRAILRQPGQRICLIDLDVAHPGIAAALQIPGCDPLGAHLAAGRALSDLSVCLTEEPGLTVLAPAAPEMLAAELLQSPQLAAALEAMQLAEPCDYQIMDLAPLSESDIGLSALPLVDAVLLIADGSRGQAEDMKLAQRYLRDDLPLMGVVLNKAEK